MEVLSSNSVELLLLFVFTAWFTKAFQNFSFCQKDEQSLMLKIPTETSVAVEKERSFHEVLRIFFSDGNVL